MNNHKYIHIYFGILFFTLHPGKILGMKDSLLHKCVNVILLHPEYFLKNHQKTSNIPAEVKDTIRQCWFSAHEMTNPWWAQLCSKNLVKVARMGTLGPIELNREHTLIKTQMWNGDFDGCGARTVFYDMKGKLLNPSGHCKKPDPIFIPEKRTSDADEQFLRFLGFKSPHLWQVGCAAKKTKDHQLIVNHLHCPGIAEIFDLKLYNKFLNYAEQRMPLFQVLLLKVLENAFEQGNKKNNKLKLSEHEAQILNGMPPQFEQVITFLKKHVK